MRCGLEDIQQSQKKEMHTKYTKEGSYSL